MLPQGIELKIVCELGANAVKIEVYKYRMFCGWLVGYRNHRAQTLKCFPYRRLDRGTFSEGELPLMVRDDLPWKKAQ